MDAYCLKPDELPDLAIETLGAPTIDSPLARNKRHFVDDDEKIIVYSHSDNTRASGDSHRQPPTFERAGPRRKIFFETKKLNCGIVTCGGLCPGLNDVIRTITLSLLWSYGVRKVFGFRYGYAGLSSKAPQPPLPLTPELVNDIHLKGGDILSSSRGPQDVDDMVDNLQKLDIGILFVIGGDGT
ncbi:MAG: 6-phosphofructokinase [Planctomycetota bacterium]|jgi:6-phosphofructokinase 1